MKFVLLSILLTILASVTFADNVKLNMFIMSQCPDVKSYMSTIVNPLMATLGSIIDLKIDFVAKEDPNSKYGFVSMHGDNEVLGDLLEGCMQGLSKNQTAVYNTISCATANYGSLLSYLPLCAKNSNLDVEFETIQTCALGDQGKSLMRTSVRKTELMQVKNSPTLYIGDEMVCEWHGKTCHMTHLEEYQKMICGLKEGSKPDICKNF